MVMKPIRKCRRKEAKSLTLPTVAEGYLCFIKYDISKGSLDLKLSTSALHTFPVSFLPPPLPPPPSRCPSRLQSVWFSSFPPCVVSSPDPALFLIITGHVLLLTSAALAKLRSAFIAHHVRLSYVPPYTSTGLMLPRR
ncbi:hypothetical protein EYF80_017239 [Liparis tanakae]|uniref:Uncharacterized protein n=1 Tax=Liparis tanakae TaxID=230148 RepID=A0A4Z2I5G6_9TELE|nr:hypothetical protein EYF80_017239 [Liparis tanakae]